MPHRMLPKNRVAPAANLAVYGRHFPPAGRPSVLLIIPPYPTRPDRLSGVSYLAGTLTDRCLMERIRVSAQERGLPQPESVPDFHVRVLDLSLVPSDFDLKVFLERFNPTLLGVSAVTPTFNQAVRIAEVARVAVPEALRVVGGYHPSALPEAALLQSRFQVAVVGYGEETLGELAMALYHLGRSELQSYFDTLPGVYAKNATGQIVTGGVRELAIPLDDYRFPHEVFPLYIFGDYPNERFDDQRIGYLVGSRGCPFRCEYCCGESVHRRRVRVRSAANILTEATQLVEDGARRLMFNEENFMLHPEVEALLEGLARLKERHPGFGWSMQTRADRLDVASVSKLVRAGLASVGFGVETGDPALARKVKHDPMINMARVFQITAALQAAGVDVSYNLMVGLPGQDWASVLQTAALLVDARPMRAVVDSLKLYPGSHYAETLPKEQRRDMTPEEIVSAENLLEFIIYYLCEARAHPDIGESYVGILAESVIDAIRIWTIYDLLIGEAGKEEQRERLLKMISRDGDAIFAARFAATRNSRLMTGFGVLGAGKDSPIICDEFRVAQETLRLRRDFKHTRLDPFLARIKFTDALPICYLPFSAIRWWMIIAMNLCEMAEERVGSGFKIENVRVVGGRVFAEKLRQALIDLTNAGIQTAFAGLDLDGLVAGREVDLLGFAVKVDPATKELVCSSGLS